MPDQCVPRARRRAPAPAAMMVAALAVVGLAACASAPAGGPDVRAGVAQDGQIDPRPLVLTTFTVLADIAQNVAGDHLRVESITKPGAEIHGYAPTPSDLRRADGAALILDNGLGLESWLARFTRGQHVPHVTVSEGIEAIPIAAGEDAGAPNPHAWMSPVNGARYVEVIAEAFSELDPDHGADYRRDGEAYRAELARLRDDVAERLAQLPPSQRVLVTCEGAFSYLARDAGLHEAYLWPVNAEQQARPRAMARAVDVVRDREVTAVFCESTVSDRSMRRVVEASGGRYGGTLYVDSLSTAEGPVPTYLALLRYDTDLIAAGLTRKEA